MSKAKSRVPARQSSAPTPRVEQIERELDAWLARAVPDASTPLDADDIARLVRGGFVALGIPAAGESFSVNTVHYYRRKDILDEPEGRTSAARYSVRHLWQAIGARLAGFLGLVTLAEARKAFHGADVATLRRFVAERVADARGRQASREAGEMGAVHVAAAAPASHAEARPLPDPHAVVAHAAAAPTAAVIPLGGNAMCLIPGGHEAMRSPSAARALVDALAAALGVE